MKNPTRREAADDELGQYLRDRPGLLLKMLDIAEARQERDVRPLRQARRTLPVKAFTHSF